jgi:hypothetical protein
MQLCAYYQEKIPYICHTSYLSLFIDDCLPVTYIVTNTRCGIGTVIFPDDGHIVSRKNVQKIKKYIKKNCTPIWFCLQVRSTNFELFSKFSDNVTDAVSSLNEAGRKIT